MDNHWGNSLVRKLKAAKLPPFINTNLTDKYISQIGLQAQLNAGTYQNKNN
jgi:hypothetical protein